MSLRVLVAGGGIGGLCLAQGLRQAGIDVVVFERAPSPAAFREGYRLHISPEGSRALHTCLSADLFATVQATSGRPPRAMSFLTERLAELLSVEVLPDQAEPDPIAAHRSVNRYTLRQILLSGLDDAMHFGKECTGYERHDDDKVTLRFADGTTADGTVVIGAEGGHSAVRAQLLPHAGRQETGMVSIGGRLPLTGETASLLPPHLARGPASILAPHGLSLFIATHQAVVSDRHRHLAPADAGDQIVWGFTGPRDRLPIAHRSHQDLRRLVLDHLHGWDRRLRSLVEQSDPATVNATLLRTAVPIEAWSPSNVTVLGDAIHSMPPSLGMGANIALRDAEVLTQKLAAVHDGRLALVRAIGEYEREMRGYGFAAVSASNRALRQSAMTNPFAFAATKAAMRLLNVLPPVKKRIFR
ncbi:FAD-dependent oxidoreductase [Nonomuraea cavernae]|uniref:FAD-dependent oxidoreductase n=1 Tax=Nonomuraea cavernae TaxID=2045107 RepID=A0A918DH22_9ACTN|nr:NAD(P)/FAD-dependent oxidoreductase [Nonomuraea cavernae]MCA2185469.1 FAD-dependent monooxygenase [Nonomuraea cavernae]GGO66569.1 FAD-dependent oxidoreductase [Nonomuraea cavernae]